jgi:phage terminase small subunit
MLTPKQAAFVREYLKDSNGTQAATRAGYSPRTANEQASRLLANVNIIDELSRLRASVQSASIATYEQTCERMTQIMLGGSDADSIKAADRLAKLKGWDGATKIAPTTPDGTQPYQPAISADEAVATYMEAIQRAVSTRG